MAIETRAYMEEFVTIGDFATTVGVSRRYIYQITSKAIAPEQSGGVYFVRTGDFVKIGWSKSLDKRLEAIRVANPLECELLLVIKTDNKAEESELHKRFFLSHHRGEWFHFSQEIEAFINEYKSEPL